MEYKKIYELELQKDIEELIKVENLGITVKNITKVVGGLSHKMYKVITDRSIYAVKELSPGIIKRPEAYSNFVFSEKVADIEKENGITVIGAIKLKNNDIMRKINHRYFMVFDWVEGRILKSEEITEEHCKTIGQILAKMHNIDFSKIEDNNRKKVNMEQFDWHNYLKMAKKEIDKNIEKLIYANIYNVLGWINYNFKRSLCIENEYEQDEIELAEDEIVKAMEEIKYNVSQMNNMMNILKM